MVPVLVPKLMSTTNLQPFNGAFTVEQAIDPKSCGKAGEIEILKDLRYQLGYREDLWRRDRAGHGRNLAHKGTHARARCEISRRSARD